jgi:hypothetical protein
VGMSRIGINILRPSQESRAPLTKVLHNGFEHVAVFLACQKESDDEASISLLRMCQRRECLA